MKRNYSLTTAVLVGGQELHGVHHPDVCAGQACCIHNPSNHHMATWTQNWREDRRMVERICKCGIGHPDPDWLTYRRRKEGARKSYYEGVHGCCGCCKPPTQMSDLVDQAQVPPNLRLPDGTTTSSETRYHNKWKKFGKLVCSLLGEDFEVVKYDPGLVIRCTNADLPRETTELSPIAAKRLYNLAKTIENTKWKDYWYGRV